ncbi:MAG: IS110 family transposase [Dehalococcoidia bacterium]
MDQDTVFVGMDVHKASINLAMLLPETDDPVEWQIANELAAVRRMVRKVVRQALGESRYCYEAGPCGFALQRQIEAASKEVSCAVVAPSLIPVKPGERIKTDRRDARKLAELDRAHLLTEILPPTEEDEALRDLCRARDSVRSDLGRSRHRLSKFLLRHGIAYSGGKRAWTQMHGRWLDGLNFERPAEEMVFGHYRTAVAQHEERRRELDQRLDELSQQEPYATPVGWLRCFRGIDTVTAMSLVAELHDFRRFESARGLMAYLGLVPSEYSSGETRRRGSITKTGNSHARRLLVEAAWHYRHRPGVRALRKRREGQPAEIIAIADKAQRRLHRRYRRMTEANKPAPVVVVAVARELVGFLWAALRRGVQ